MSKQVYEGEASFCPLLTTDPNRPVPCRSTCMWALWNDFYRKSEHHICAMAAIAAIGMKDNELIMNAVIHTREDNRVE